MAGFMPGAVGGWLGVRRFPTGVGPALLIADGIVQGVVQLAAINDLAYEEGTMCWVRDETSVGDWFRLEVGTTLTADNITVVNASSGTKQWVRMFVPNPFWQQKQDFWAIDPVNGDDENAGWGTTQIQAEGRPLKTLAEFMRRIKGMNLTQIAVCSVMNDLTEHVWIGGFTAISIGGFDVGPNAFLAFLGKPVVVHSGVLSGAVPQAGNTRGTITDAALPVSWVAAGCVSTTTEPRLIRGPDNKHAWIVAEPGAAKTAQIATPTATSETVQQQVGILRSDFAPGDAYDVLDLPWFSHVMVQPGCPIRLYLLNVQADVNDNGASLNAPIGTGVSSIMTAFTKTTLIGGSIGLFNSMLAESSITGAGVQFVQSCFFSDSGLGCSIFSTRLHCAGLQTFYGTRLVCTESTVDFVETGSDVEFGFWDCVFRAIILESQSSIRIDKLMGEGNAGAMIYYNTPSTKTHNASGTFVDWTATCVGPPISMFSGNFDYVDLPKQDTYYDQYCIGTP